MVNHTREFLKNMGYTDEEIKEIEDRTEALADAEPIDYPTSVKIDGMQLADQPTVTITIETTDE